MKKRLSFLILLIISIFISGYIYYDASNSDNATLRQDNTDECSLQNSYLYNGRKSIIMVNHSLVKSLDSEIDSFDPSPVYNSFEEIEENPADVKSLFIDSMVVSNGDIIGNYSNIKFLSISNSQICDFRFLSKLPNLEYLSFESNEISDITGLNQIKNKNKIKLLDLGKNFISDISVLSKFKNINRLILWENEGIKDISALKHMKKLEKLYLNNNNQIRSLEPLYRLPSLQCVYCSNTFLIQKEDMKQLKNRLLLTKNEYTYDYGEKYSCIIVNEELPDLYSVQGNDISNGTEREYDTLEAIQGDSKKIKALTIRNMVLNDGGVIEDFSNLEYLSMNETQINDYQFLSKLPKLKYLYLDSDNISDLSGLNQVCNKENIEVLTLNYNDITDISILSMFVGVKELELMCNNIEEINSLSNMYSLEYLELVDGNCNIRSLKPLNNHKKLKRILISTACPLSQEELDYWGDRVEQD